VQGASATSKSFRAAISVSKTITVSFKTRGDVVDDALMDEELVRQP